MKLFFFAACVLLALSSIAFAVEPKEVGSANITLDLQWAISGSALGAKTFKTFGFPNTTFQTVFLTSDTPFTVEKDSFGNQVLLFSWNDNNPKSIFVRAKAFVNYDGAGEKASAQDASAFSAPTQLVKVDDSIATQAALLSQGAQSDFEKLVRFTDWVHNAVTYDLSFQQSAITSTEIFVQRRGVCNQYAILDMALLRAAGIPSRFVAGWVYSGKEWNRHAWLEAFINGEWVQADPTYGEAGILDGTHVAFAYGFDQLDIKEEVTQGLALNESQSVDLDWWDYPRGFFDLTLKAPSKVGSNAAETLVAVVDNKDPKPRAVPLLLEVPTQPPELAVKITGGASKLLFIPAGAESQAQWSLIFPKLETNFVYNFTLDVQSFGKQASATVVGEPRLASQSKASVILSNLDSAQNDAELSITATLSNSGNEAVQANVSVVLGNASETQTITLQSGEVKTASFTFPKPLSSNSGSITVSIPGGVPSTQPFEITQAPQSQPSTTEGGASTQTIALVVGVVIVLSAAVYFLHSRNPPLQEE